SARSCAGVRTKRWPSKRVFTSTSSPRWKARALAAKDWLAVASTGSTLKTTEMTSRQAANWSCPRRSPVLNSVVGTVAFAIVPINPQCGHPVKPRGRRANDTRARRADSKPAARHVVRGQERLRVVAQGPARPPPAYGGIARGTDRGIGAARDFYRHPNALGWPGAGSAVVRERWSGPFGIAGDGGGRPRLPAAHGAAVAGRTRHRTRAGGWRGRCRARDAAPTLPQWRGGLPGSGAGRPGHAGHGRRGVHRARGAREAGARGGAGQRAGPGPAQHRAGNDPGLRTAGVWLRRETADPGQAAGRVVAFGRCPASGC